MLFYIKDSCLFHEKRSSILLFTLVLNHAIRQFCLHILHQIFSTFQLCLRTHWIWSYWIGSRGYIKTINMKVCHLYSMYFHFRDKLLTKISRNAERSCFFRKKKIYGSTAYRKSFILFSFSVIARIFKDELMTSSCGKTVIMANEKGCVCASKL